MSDGIALEQRYVCTEKDKRHNAEQRAVAGADLHFLEGEVQLVLSTQFFIHQHTNRNRQRLRTNVAGHIENQRLEADDDRQHGYNAFKCTDNGRNAHAEEQQDDQPRQALFHAFPGGFVEILLGGQTGELCIVLAELVIHGLDNVLCGDDTDDLSILIQHRQGVFGIIFDLLDAL